MPSTPSACQQLSEQESPAIESAFDLQHCFVGKAEESAQVVSTSSPLVARRQPTTQHAIPSPQGTYSPLQTTIAQDQVILKLPGHVRPPKQIRLAQVDEEMSVRPSLARKSRGLRHP